MKNKIIALVLVCGLVLATLSGCGRASHRVSHNISLEADNFNIVRQLTVINCLQGDILFQMTGCMSISVDEQENQLEITVELEDGTYKKHFIGLSDNVTYVVEDITGADVNQYKYTINFNPNMWWPVNLENID